mmetsp:Transcript_17267/g.42868  ORF Transcript_17267/g.42868 Transcript_17267/m.42868 type:complete len:2041 (-) Transcript_17267:1945-8067(-)
MSDAGAAKAPGASSIENCSGQGQAGREQDYHHGEGKYETVASSSALAAPQQPGGHGKNGEQGAGGDMKMNNSSCREELASPAQEVDGGTIKNAVPEERAAQGAGSASGEVADQVEEFPGEQVMNSGNPFNAPATPLGVPAPADNDDENFEVEQENENVEIDGSSPGAGEQQENNATEQEAPVGREDAPGHDHEMNAAPEGKPAALELQKLGGRSSHKMHKNERSNAGQGRQSEKDAGAHCALEVDAAAISPVGRDAADNASDKVNTSLGDDGVTIHPPDSGKSESTPGGAGDRDGEEALLADSGTGLPRMEVDSAFAAEMDHEKDQVRAALAEEQDPNIMEDVDAGRGGSDAGAHSDEQPRSPLAVEGGAGSITSSSENSAQLLEEPSVPEAPQQVVGDNPFAVRPPGDGELGLEQILASSTSGGSSDDQDHSDNVEEKENNAEAAAERKRQENERLEVNRLLSACFGEAPVRTEAPVAPAPPPKSAEEQEFEDITNWMKSMTSEYDPTALPEVVSSSSREGQQEDALGTGNAEVESAAASDENKSSEQQQCAGSFDPSALPVVDASPSGSASGAAPDGAGPVVLGEILGLEDERQEGAVGATAASSSASVGQAKINAGLISFKLGGGGGSKNKEEKTSAEGSSAAARGTSQSPRGAEQSPRNALMDSTREALSTEQIRNEQAMQRAQSLMNSVGRSPRHAADEGRASSTASDAAQAALQRQGKHTKQMIGSKKTTAATQPEKSGADPDRGLLPNQYVQPGTFHQLGMPGQHPQHFQPSMHPHLYQQPQVPGTLPGTMLGGHPQLAHPHLQPQHPGIGIHPNPAMLGQQQHLPGMPLMNHQHPGYNNPQYGLAHPYHAGGLTSGGQLQQHFAAGAPGGIPQSHGVGAVPPTMMQLPQHQMAHLPGHHTHLQHPQHQHFLQPGAAAQHQIPDTRLRQDPQLVPQHQQTTALQPHHQMVQQQVQQQQQQAQLPPSGQLQPATPQQQPGAGASAPQQHIASPQQQLQQQPPAPANSTDASSTIVQAAPPPATAAPGAAPAAPGATGGNTTTTPADSAQPEAAGAKGRPSIHTLAPIWENQLRFGSNSILCINMSGMQMTDEKMRMWAQWMDEIVKGLVDARGQLRNAKVDFSKNPLLTDIGFRRVTTLMKKHRVHVREFVISENVLLSDLSVRYLIEYVKASENPVHKVSLLGNNISPDSIVALGLAMQAHAAYPRFNASSKCYEALELRVSKNLKIDGTRLDFAASARSSLAEAAGPGGATEKKGLGSITPGRTPSNLPVALPPHEQEQTIAKLFHELRQKGITFVCDAKQATHKTTENVPNFFFADLKMVDANALGGPQKSDGMNRTNLSRSSSGCSSASVGRAAASSSSVSVAPPHGAVPVAGGGFLDASILSSLFDDNEGPPSSSCSAPAGTVGNTSNRGEQMRSASAAAGDMMMIDNTTAQLGRARTPNDQASSSGTGAGNASRMPDVPPRTQQMPQPPEVEPSSILNDVKAVQDIIAEIGSLNFVAPEQFDEGSLGSVPAGLGGDLFSGGCTGGPGGAGGFGDGSMKGGHKEQYINGGKSAKGKKGKFGGLAVGDAIGPPPGSFKGKGKSGSKFGGGAGGQVSTASGVDRATLEAMQYHSYYLQQLEMQAASQIREQVRLNGGGAASSERGASEGRPGGNLSSASSTMGGGPGGSSSLSLSTGGSQLASSLSSSLLSLHSHESSGGSHHQVDLRAGNLHRGVASDRHGQLHHNPHRDRDHHHQPPRERDIARTLARKWICPETLAVDEENLKYLPMIRSVVTPGQERKKAEGGLAAALAGAGKNTSASTSGDGKDSMADKENQDPAATGVGSNGFSVATARTTSGSSTTSAPPPPSKAMTMLNRVLPQGGGPLFPNKGAARATSINARAKNAGSAATKNKPSLWKKREGTTLIPPVLIRNAHTRADDHRLVSTAGDGGGNTFGDSGASDGRDGGQNQNGLMSLLLLNKENTGGNSVRQRNHSSNKAGARNVLPPPPRTPSSAVLPPPGGGSGTGGTGNNATKKPSGNTFFFAERAGP